MAEGNYTCAHCERPFWFHRKKKFCSVSCRDKEKRRRNGIRPWQQYVDERKRSSENWYTCRICGEPFYRKLGGGQANARYCSRSCYGTHLSRLKADIGAYRRMARLVVAIDMKLSVARRLAVRREVLAIRSIASACTKTRTNLIHECRWCHGLHVPSRTKTRPTRYCSVECRNKANREAEKAYRRKRRRKIGSDSARARARRYGVAYEPVHVTRVFNRDGWRCQMCGKPTPEARRGTHYSNAPELDHRVPLSRGGTHTYDNVQCSCRACNGAKSNKHSAGQYSFIYQ